MSVLDSLNFWLGKSDFLATRAKIYADMAEAIADNESLQSVLQKRIIRAADKKRPIEFLYRKWFRRLGQGMGFSDAAKEELDPFDYMVLSTFERAGKLEEGMTFLGKSISKIKEANSVLVKSMIGPGIVFALAIAMMTGFALFVVPMITQIYPPERWPLVGRILYAISSAIKNYGVLMAAGLGAFVFGVAYSMPRLTGDFRSKLDRMPFYNTYRRINGITTLIGLASQLKVGVSLVESVKHMSSGNTPYMRWQLSRVQKNLSITPDAYGKAFDIGLFDDEIMFRLIDFAERSSFPRAVEKVGLESFDETVNGIKASAEVVGGVAKAFAGFIITFTIISFLFTAQGIRKDVQEQQQSRQQ